MNVPQKTLDTMTRAVIVIALVLFASFGSVPVAGQGGGGAPQGGGGGVQGGGQGGRGQGQGGRGGQAQPSNLPSAPTAVTLPTLSAEVTGPGPMFNSASSLPPGKELAAFKYEAHEYFVSGTANGQPYNTRIVVRRPANPSAFSGLVLAESMHSSGAAHMFEFTSIYTMSSGHIAVDMLTSSPQQFVQMNEARYKDLRVAGGQTNEIIAQIGALIRTGKPLGGLSVRKMVLSGTSMSAGVLINYLPAHMVYRTPEMQRIFDGFMPTSNGSTVQDIDVPLIQLPTMHEVVGNITTRQDSDEPGKQYRLYEFAGIAHVDTRDSVRFKPNPCAQPISEFPNQAYMSVGLHHLFQWVDKGIVAPRAERVWLDQDEHNDGSRMVLDEQGNPRGGIRNPYVDVPTAKYVIRPPAITPLIANPSAWIVANGGQTGANLMCGLAGAQLPFSQAKLKELYKSRKNYASMVEKRLTELEKAGWSLPVYRETILADANKVTF
jgi:alpha/beta hydrolase family protein